MARPARRLIRLRQEGHLRVVVWKFACIMAHRYANWHNELAITYDDTKRSLCSFCADVWRACKSTDYGCRRAWYGNKASKISINYWSVVAAFFFSILYACGTFIGTFAGLQWNCCTLRSGTDVNTLILNLVDKRRAPHDNRQTGISFTLN